MDVSQGTGQLFQGIAASSVRLSKNSCLGLSNKQSVSGQLVKTLN